MGLFSPSNIDHPDSRSDTDSASVSSFDEDMSFDGNFDDDSMSVSSLDEEAGTFSRQGGRHGRYFLCSM